MEITDYQKFMTFAQAHHFCSWFHHCHDGVAIAFIITSLIIVLVAAADAVIAATIVPLALIPH